MAGVYLATIAVRYFLDQVYTMLIKFCSFTILKAHPFWQSFRSLKPPSVYYACVTVTHQLATLYGNHSVPSVVSFQVPRAMVRPLLSVCNQRHINLAITQRPLLSHFRCPEPWYAPCYQCVISDTSTS